MSNSSGDNIEACFTNLALRKSGNLEEADFTVDKSNGSFDAEFDLLESTLSELKDNEQDTTNSINTDKDLNFNTDIELRKSFSNIVSAVPLATEIPESPHKIFCDSSQDISHNRPDLEPGYSLPTTRYSKSVFHQVISANNSEDELCPHLNSNLSESRIEIQNTNSVEGEIKAECVQTGNDSDKKSDRPPSLSFERLDSEYRGSLHVTDTGRQETIHSEEDCALETVGNKSLINLANKQQISNLEPLHNTLVNNSVTNCEPSLGIVSSMEDKTKLSDENIDSEVPQPQASCHGGKSNDDLTKVSTSETDGSKVLKFEAPQSVNVCVEDQGNKSTVTVKESVDCNTTNPNNVNCKIAMGLESDASNKNVFGETIEKQEMFCSTPIVAKTLQEALSDQSLDAVAPDFGLVSPLNVKPLKGKQNLKRKLISLHPIEEVDEDESNEVILEKKMKSDKDVDKIPSSCTSVEAGTSSTHPCFEVPAKSLLKKWHPSCLSRNLSSGFIILDECGYTDVDNCSRELESSNVDDFEKACQSLTEELLKSSSNIETLEKYHSQVQLENQMDDEKFDEIFKELTMFVDLDEKTCLSVKSMDESILSEAGKSCHLLVDKSKNDPDVDSYAQDNTVFPLAKSTTVIETNNQNTDSGSCNDPIIGNTENITDVLKNSDDNAPLELTPNNEKPSASNEEILNIDKEDLLLEENGVSKAKNYEFFEFVSNDPKENEDNYNPEWQKLARLTTDEERYKAVRDRWRSLVPPDPNRNLTFRQWRTRNNKSPIRLSSLNNNHQLMDDNEKNQLCTAVFDNKIKKTVQELEDSRMNIYRQRKRQFEELGHVQDEEQMRATMSGFNYIAIKQLHNHHLNQCMAVKNQYDQELKRIKQITEGKIQILKEAKQEVLFFQKFYRGVGAQNDNEMYLTDIQVQELMETEDMLEQYRSFYK